jgi:hypothetical protein
VVVILDSRLATIAFFSLGILYGQGSVVQRLASPASLETFRSSFFINKAGA